MKEQKDTLKVKKDKVKGGLVGLVIGDALGLPISGMKKEEVEKTVGKITKFTTNYRHPYFYFLKKGQYGSNTRLILASLEDLVEHRFYNEGDLRERLTSIAKKSKNDFFYSRWLGETVTKALLSGQSVVSESCTCIYRSAPIALLYDDLDKALEDSEKQSLLTHSSSLSLASSYFLTHMLFHLKKEQVDPRSIAEKAFEEIKKKYSYLETKKLIDNLHMVLSGEIEDINHARTIIGTSSLSYHVIPLSLYIFLKNQNNFEESVIAGANSSRDDNEEQKVKLQYLSYINELSECRGGDTNAIATISGSLTGTYLGYSSIAHKFLDDLEDRTKIIKLTDRYFDLFSYGQE